MKHRSQAGFTLLEVLLAIGLLMSISLFAISSISVQLDNRNRLTILNERQHTLHMAMARLVHDLSHAYILAREDFFSARLTERAFKPFLLQNSEALRFTSQGYDSLKPGAPEGNIANLKYFERTDPKESSKKQLVRIIDTDLKESIDSQGVGTEQVLINDLKEFKVTFWNGVDFVDAWDTIHGDYTNTLPKMAKVRLSIFLPSADELEGKETTGGSAERRSLPIETYVYFWFSEGRPDKQTPAKEYTWR